MMNQFNFGLNCPLKITAVLEKYLNVLKYRQRFKIKNAYPVIS